LTQIIFEQENKQGQNLLPITFLRQLIRFYGDSMQMLVPRYLESSLDLFSREQEKFREQMAQAWGVGRLGTIEEQVRQNMDMFQRAFTLFTPFARQEGQGEEADEGAKSDRPIDEISALKRQLEEMQKRLDRLSAAEADKTKA
jgi:polyhydroxyalkanoate synthesis regulator protein